MYSPAAREVAQQLGLKMGRANLEVFADTLLALAKENRDDGEDDSAGRYDHSAAREVRSGGWILRNRNDTSIRYLPLDGSAVQIHHLKHVAVLVRDKGEPEVWFDQQAVIAARTTPDRNAPDPSIPAATS